jgi:hypothetical protein
MNGYDEHDAYQDEVMREIFRRNERVRRELATFRRGWLVLF